MSDITARPLSPIADGPSALPAPTSSPSSIVTLLACPLDASPCVPAAVLYFTRYCTVRLKLFYFLCLIFVYYLCEEYYKPITVQYYIAACVSWVPKQTLLDL